jgi:hypothetical protein
MSRPMFAVGEVVILQSVEFPHLNGDATVLAVTKPRVPYKCPATGISVIRSASNIGYVLDVDKMVATSLGELVAANWDESALRKKHQPGEHSFTRLMQSLKQGQPA